MKKGERYRFFDSVKWSVTGDVGDNDCYWLPATVERVYIEDGRELADIRFDHRPRLSTGHFTDLVKEDKS